MTLASVGRYESALRRASIDGPKSPAIHSGHDSACMSARRNTGILRNLTEDGDE